MMANFRRFFAILMLFGLVVCSSLVRAGIIKDIFQKVTNTNNKTEETVKESAPICGHGIFSTPNEGDLSPELIFITNRQSKAYSAHERSHQRQDQQNNEVALEFRFHAENVSISELEHNGFNPDAPVTFLMHGFTSGYPLQAWISAIVEAYTIDRETSSGRDSRGSLSSLASLSNHGVDSGETYENHHSRHSLHRDELSPSSGSAASRRDRDEESRRRRISAGGSGRLDRIRDSFTGEGRRVPPVEHNLFIVNWNYAARGIIYPRAVANIPIVASYVTRFINNKLIEEARVDPRRIQLIGHSLGAHLAGYIGKNTRSKLGRIYGLDPAGPCFGAVAGPLYPSSKRLAPADAEEVITIQTNSALLGIQRPLGRYSVFVEGGADQPGCKSSGVLKSLGTLTFDGGDFDTVACSHSRAPNLITYRHDQKDTDDSCLMIAYACKDWESFTKGQCGVCRNRGDSSLSDSLSRPNRNRSPDWDRRKGPMEPVECLRIGLEWQYPKARPSYESSSGSRPFKPSRPDDASFLGPAGQRDPIRPIDQPDDLTTTRRPWSSSSSGIGLHSTRRPFALDSDRTRRFAKMHEDRDTETPERKNSSSSSSSAFSSLTSFFSSSGNSSRSKQDEDDDEVEPIQMFMKTSDTQPYCAFHYQLVLELNEPFEKKQPPMAIILQDSEPESERRRGSTSGGTNSLSSDEFGHRFDDKTYTHLLTSYRKLRRVDHATLMVRSGLKDGHRVLKALNVNYMSHSDPYVRRRLSSRLCPVKTDTDREAISGEGSNRFYFKPCDREERPYSTLLSELSPSSIGNGSQHFHRHTTHSSGLNTDRENDNHRDRDYNPSRGERDHVEHNLSHHHSNGRDHDRN